MNEVQTNDKMIEEEEREEEKEKEKDKKEERYSAVNEEKKRCKKMKVK